jgi:hypothetical protein
VRRPLTRGIIRALGGRLCALPRAGSARMFEERVEADSREFRRVARAVWRFARSDEHAGRMVELLESVGERPDNRTIQAAAVSTEKQIPHFVRDDRGGGRDDREEAFASGREWHGARGDPAIGDPPLRHETPFRPLAEQRAKEGSIFEAAPFSYGSEEMGGRRGKCPLCGGSKFVIEWRLCWKEFGAEGPPRQRSRKVDGPREGFDQMEDLPAGSRDADVVSCAAKCPECIKEAVGVGK